jgi:hypothetical protein
MAVFVQGYLWRSLPKLDGQVLGIDLDMQFALRSYGIKCTEAMRPALEEFVWERFTIPGFSRSGVQSDIFTFVDDSMLIREIYVRHPDQSPTPGIVLFEPTWNNGMPQGLMMRYRYRDHEREQVEKYFVNEWLRYVFGLWATFMQAQLVVKEKAG